MEGQDVVDDGRFLDLPSGHVILGWVDVVGTLRPESLKRSKVTWLYRRVFEFIFLLQSTVMDILPGNFQMTMELLVKRSLEYFLTSPYYG